MGTHVEISLLIFLLVVIAKTTCQADGASSTAQQSNPTTVSLNIISAPSQPVTSQEPTTKLLPPVTAIQPTSVTSQEPTTTNAASSTAQQSIPTTVSLTIISASSQPVTSQEPTTKLLQLVTSQGNTITPTSVTSQKRPSVLPQSVTMQENVITSTSVTSQVTTTQLAQPVTIQDYTIKPTPVTSQYSTGFPSPPFTTPPNLVTTNAERSTTDATESPIITDGNVLLTTRPQPEHVTTPSNMETTTPDMMDDNMQRTFIIGENTPIVSNDCMSGESLDDLYNGILNLLSQEFGAGVLGRTRQLYASSCDQIRNDNQWSTSGIYWVRNGTAINQQYCVF